MPCRDVAEVASVHLALYRYAPGSSGEGPSGGATTNISSSILAGPSAVCGSGISPGRLSLEILTSRDLLSQARGTTFHPQPEILKLWVWPWRGTSS